MWTTIIKWISTNWAWFKGFFSETDGPSTTRALNWIWLICLCCNLTFLTVYGTLKTKVPTLPPIEATSGYVVITSLLLAAKVGQRIWGENPVDGTTNTSSSLYSNLLSQVAAQYSGSVSGSNGITPIIPSAPLVYNPNTGSNGVTIP